MMRTKFVYADLSKRTAPAWQKGCVFAMMGISPVAHGEPFCFAGL